MAEAISSMFADRVVGVWLVGSHAYGGATEQSDIDIQACVDEASAAEVGGLAELIAHPRLWCPGAGLEFVLYDSPTLAEPVVPLRWLLNLNGGQTREHTVSFDPATESWHWFVLDLVIAREFGRTISGRPLAEILGPIEREVQLEALAQSYRWHALNDDAGPNRQANAARGLRFLRTNRWGSKPAGLEWAREAGLHHPDEIVDEFGVALVEAGVRTQAPEPPE